MSDALDLTAAGNVFNICDYGSADGEISHDFIGKVVGKEDISDNETQKNKSIHPMCATIWKEVTLVAISEEGISCNKMILCIHYIVFFEMPLAWKCTASSYLKNYFDHKNSWKS